MRVLTSGAASRGALSSVWALGLLLSAAPLAQAGGTHNGGSRRGNPPPPPAAFAPQPTQPQPTAGSNPGTFNPGPLNPGPLNPGRLNPGRLNLPGGVHGGATSAPSLGSAPFTQAPRPTLSAPPRPAWRTEPSLGSNAAPVPTPTFNRPALTRPTTFGQPTTVWGGAGDQAAARERLRLTLQQGGAWQGNQPGQPAPHVWRPQAGTVPSPGMDSGAPMRLERPNLNVRPSTALVRPPSASLPNVAHQGGVTHAGQGRLPTATTAPLSVSTPVPQRLRPTRPVLAAAPSTSTAGERWRLRPPGAQVNGGFGQAAPLGTSAQSHGIPNPGTPNAAWSPVRPLASGLPTHTGGVHYGGAGSSAPASGAPFVGGVPPQGGQHHGGSHPTRPYPAWGFAPQPWPMQPAYPVINVFGYGDPSGHCCCPPAPSWPEPAPVLVVPEPYPVPEPYYVPAPYPVFVESPAPAPTVWPEPVPAPPAPSYEAPGFPEPAPAAEPLTPQAPAPDPVTSATPEAADAARAAAFRVAFEAFRRAEYEGALTGFLALTQNDPKFGEAWMAVAHAALALSRYDVSAQAVAKAAALGGFPRGYRFDPAPLYPDPQDFAGFLAALERQVAQQPEDADARLTLGWLYASLGRRALAQDQIQQVLTLRPGDPAAPVLALALLPAAPQAPADAAREVAPAPAAR